METVPAPADAKDGFSPVEVLVLFSVVMAMFFVAISVLFFAQSGAQTWQVARGEGVRGTFEATSHSCESARGVEACSPRGTFTSPDHRADGHPRWVTYEGGPKPRVGDEVPAVYVGAGSDVVYAPSARPFVYRLAFVAASLAVFAAASFYGVRAVRARLARRRRTEPAPAA